MNFLGRFVGAALVLFLTSCECDVDKTWMQDALKGYFSQARHHWTNPAYKAKAMRFIRDQFRSSGLETHIHTFDTAQPNITGVNIIGMLRGPYFNTPHDKVVGIGAHYDTMRNTPGVDDNGAAVVTMLEAAREITRQPKRNYTVLFIAFDFEEWETQDNTMAACITYLCGSAKLVQQWIPNFWTEPVGWRGIFVMDTIMNFNGQPDTQHFPDDIGAAFPSQSQSVQSDGGKGDFLMVAGRMEDKALLTAFNTTWHQQGKAQFELEIFTVPQLLVSDQSDFTRSDHYHFWEAGLNALFITDTADFRGYMTQCYHHECDTFDRVTDSMVDFAVKTCNTLISLVNTLSPTVDVTSASDHPGSGGLLIIVVSLVTMHVAVQRFPWSDDRSGI